MAGETVREVLYRWKDASPEERAKIEAENPRMGDFRSLLPLLEASARMAMAQHSRFGLTTAAEVEAKLDKDATLQVWHSSGQYAEVEFTPGELTAICDALVLALPSWGDEVRAALTIEARLKIMDAIGVDERSPDDPLAEIDRIWLDGQEVTPGPGKFQGCGDERVAEILYSLSLEQGGCDEEYGDSETGWVGRVRDFVLHQDSQGFFGYARLRSVSAAELQFNADKVELGFEPGD